MYEDSDDDCYIKLFKKESNEGSYKPMERKKEKLEIKKN